MALPTYDQFCNPVLDELAALSAPIRIQELYTLVARRTNLTPGDVAETIPSGQLTYQNRIGWACTAMKWAGWVEGRGRGLWQITPSGRERRVRTPVITAAEVRAAKNGAQPGDGQAATPPQRADEDASVATPQERIDAALAEIEAYVRADLSERLSRGGDTFFEQTALRLLGAMGYAGHRGRAEHTGRTGDGGVDGVMYSDRLGLERVYVQAKRWNGNSVGAKEVRDFAGAMDAESATKGVILTTSRFTAEAKRYIERSPKAIRLIDGDEMSAMMIEFGVGVSPERTVVVQRVDSDFFDE